MPLALLPGTVDTAARRAAVSFKALSLGGAPTAVFTRCRRLSKFIHLGPHWSGEGMQLGRGGGMHRGAGEGLVGGVVRGSGKRDVD